MTTSMTIGLTKIDTAKLVDKAIRRCGVSPAQQTPEIVSTALEDLYMLLLSMSNRGLNLWCVEKLLFAQIPGQARYQLPVGTQQLLNVLQASNTVAVPSVITPTAQYYTVDYGQAVGLVRIGFALTAGTASFLLEASDDQLVWAPVTITTPYRETLSVTAGALSWFDLTISITARYYRLSLPQSPFGIGVSAFYGVTSSSEIPMSQLNRDDYAGQPRKNFQSQSVTNFYFEKLNEPYITLWPVPSESTRCLVLFVQRQIQDVGDLQNEIDIPARWLEAITWHLALRLSLEIPGVNPERIGIIKAMAEGMTLEVEGGETDDAPVYFAPRIGVYT